MEKIQLTIAIKVVSYKDIDEELAMHSNDNNLDIMTHNKADKVIK